MIKGRNQKGIISAGGTRYLSLKVSVQFMFDCLYGLNIQDKTRLLLPSGVLRHASQVPVG